MPYTQEYSDKIDSAYKATQEEEREESAIFPYAGVIPAANNAVCIPLVPFSSSGSNRLTAVLSTAVVIASNALVSMGSGTF